MIALSTCSGVLSRYTALVAVDQDGKAYQAPKVNVPQYQELGFPLMKQCGAMQHMYMRSPPQPMNLPMARSCHPLMKSGSLFGGRSEPQPQTGGSLFGNAPPPPPPAAGGMKFDCATYGAPAQAFGAFSTGIGNSAPTFGASSAGSFSFGASAPASQARCEAASQQCSVAFGAAASTPGCMTGFNFGVQPQLSDTVDCSMESESDDVDCGRLGGLPQNATLDDDLVRDFTDSKSATEEAVSSPEDVLMNLITCQKFDGSWRLDDVAGALAVDRCDLQKSETEASDESTLATGLAIVILQEGFSDRKEEWQLLANKAKSFLQQKLGAAEELKNSISLESFLKSLMQLLKDLTAKYPNLALAMSMK